MVILQYVVEIIVRISGGIGVSVSISIRSCSCSRVVGVTMPTICIVCAMDIALSYCIHIHVLFICLAVVLGT